jgi:hypothetical protein
VSAEPRVTLRCEDCDGPFEVSARHARLVRRAIHPHKCRRCCGLVRRKRRATPIREEDRLFWIERFGRAGAIELSIAIWGRPAQTAAPPAGMVEYLAASGHEQ